MRRQLAALLLVLFAVRPAPAVMLEIRPLAEAPAAPLAVSAAASAPLTPAAMLAAPALSAAAPLPALAVPAVVAAAPVASAAAATAITAAPDAAAAATALVGPPRAAAPLPQLTETVAALAAADDNGAKAGLLGRIFAGARQYLGRSEADAALAPASGSSAPSATARLAGAPSDREIEALFAAARPGSRAIAFFNRVGNFADRAQEIIDGYVFRGESIRQQVAYERMTGPRDAARLEAIWDLLDVADARSDPAARRFLEALGRRYAHELLQQVKELARRREAGLVSPEGPRGRHLPRNALGSGDYWDMASGPNAGPYILQELEPGTHYSFFDVSPYVLSYLDALIRAKGADASAVEADIMQLKRPARPLAVLRTKNAIAYVPGFEKKLEEMADWIAPGGRLIVQNDPGPGRLRSIVTRHGGLAVRLLEQGWDLESEFASSAQAEHVHDTLIFTRPLRAGTARTAEEAGRIWQDYVESAREADFAGGFEMFGGLGAVLLRLR